MNLSTIKRYFIYSTDELTKINLFWWGIILYFAAHTITTSNQVNFIFFQLFMLVGICLFIYFGSYLVTFKFNSEYQKILFVLMIFWATVTVLRGFTLDKDEIKLMLFSPWFGVFPYYVPLVMLFSKKLILYKKAFNVLVILSFFYALYSLIFFDALTDPDPDNIFSRDMVEYFSKNLSVTIGFILLMYTYNSNRKLFFAIVILIITIFFALVRARRGLTLMLIEIFIFWYILYFIQMKRKTVMITASFIFFFVFFVLAVYLYNLGLFEKYFELMAKRGAEDSRSYVEQFFFMDMEIIDYIIGRGMSGEYYSPTVSEGSFRDVMETDYLQIILKGGVIYLALILGLLVPAIYKGMFQSNNLLAKASSFWILFWMFNLYPSTVKAFNMTYILVWLSAGICYSQEMRNIPDRALTIFFQQPRLFWGKKNKN